MRPRWQVAFLIFTMPIWLLPAMVWLGWKEGGKDTVKEVPRALRYIFTGQV